VLYTAHGFHFFKGASLLNWGLFYPAERLLAHWTDALITINREDFSHAQKFHAGHVYRLSGAGVDLERYRHAERSRGEVLEELGIPSQAKVFLSIGELNRNKNHAVLLRALHRLQRRDLHLVIAGSDHLDNRLQRMAEHLKITQQVHLLGFRTDVPELLHAADVFCFPSRREGLGFTAIEAMAAGLPLITSDRHGILDYSVDGVTGFICAPDDDKAFARAMETLADDDLMRHAMGKYNSSVAEQFALQPVLDELHEIYEKTLNTETAPAVKEPEAERAK
jgi:glycosyltransferase involved in cell wall biosynthesis